jgi:putative spermidine/putrescine transport system substrate-binding protein
MRFMSTTRREVLKQGALAAGAMALGGPIPPGFAQAKELNVVGATFNLRDVILQEFTRRTGITVKPWLNPSAQARADRLRVAPVDTLESGMDFVKYSWDEKLIAPIDLSRVPNWKRAPRLFWEGQASPSSPTGFGDNPGRMMYVDKEKTKAKYIPYMYQFDSVGYNPDWVPARNNVLSWGELFNPKWRGKAALYGIDWLGMLDAALGMHALGLLKAQDLTNLTEKEVDTVILFLKEKKKEGHFRALWKAFGELVNLMAAQEVWIADAWWPVVVEVRKKGVPCRYAEAVEGYRAWAVGSCLSTSAKNVEGVYEWFNFWLEGFAGARQSELGFYSPVDTYEKYLKPEQVREWYGGVGRDGGSVADRNSKIFVWNTKPKNQEYYTDKWNEFLAS